MIVARTELAKKIINALKRRTKPATIGQIAISADASETYTKEVLMRLVAQGVASRSTVGQKYYFKWVSNQGDLDGAHKPKTSY